MPMISPELLLLLLFITTLHTRRVHQCRNFTRASPKNSIRNSSKITPIFFKVCFPEFFFKESEILFQFIYRYFEEFLRNFPSKIEDSDPGIFLVVSPRIFSADVPDLFSNMYFQKFSCQEVLKKSDKILMQDILKSTFENIPQKFIQLSHQEFFQNLIQLNPQKSPHKFFQECFQ